MDMIVKKPSGAIDLAFHYLEEKTKMLDTSKSIKGPSTYNINTFQRFFDIPFPLSHQILFW